MEKLNEISLAEVKSIQLDILVVVHEFCINHNIKYSLSCGTLLGAARHKGYIPWDDDIDICLLRTDYENLIYSFPLLYKNKYKIVSLERDKKWDRPYAKAYDSSTVLEESGNKYKQLGVNIDIFPMDDVPENKIKWRIYDFVRRLLQNIYSLKFVKLSKERSPLKNTAIIFNRVLTGGTSRRCLANWINSYAKTNNNRNFILCFECIQGIFQRNPIKKSLFDNLELLVFENKRFLGFKDYDKYLTAGYGDWRKLPPIEKQVSHHQFKAYWK